MVNRIRGNRGDVETGMDWDMELNPFAEIKKLEGCVTRWAGRR